MSCHCHDTGNARGVTVDRVAPTDQCLTCAVKHADTAHALWTEYMYELPNRHRCQAELRLVVLHTMMDYRAIATAARDLAQHILSGTETQAEWDRLLSLVRNAYYNAHPDILSRLTPGGK